MDAKIVRERARGCLVGMAAVASDLSGRQSNRAGIQLTRMVAESLIRMRHFDLVDQIGSLVKAFRAQPSHWGPSTLQAASEHAAYVDTKSAQGRAPHHRITIATMDDEWCDLDVACKAAPIAIFHAIRHPRALDPFLTDLTELGFMTHGDPRATIAAAATACVVWNLMGFDAVPEKFPFVVAFQRDVTDVVLRLEGQYLRQPVCHERVSEALKPAWRYAASFDAIATNIPATTYALYGAPFAIATFLHRPLRFASAMSKAAQMDQSYGAVTGLVGSLCGTAVGLSGIPPDWVKAISSAPKLIDLADRLVDAALHR